MNDTMATKPQFDRTLEDLGNVVELGHVNVTVPDQEKATLFYIAGLGFTRDPYMMTGPANMWVNVGRQQFHLPTGKPQVVRGHVGVVVSDYEALPRRLTRVREALGGQHHEGNRLRRGEAGGRQGHGRDHSFPDEPGRTGDGSHWSDPTVGQCTRRLCRSRAD